MDSGNTESWGGDEEEKQQRDVQSVGTHITNPRIWVCMSTVWDLHCALEFREGCWDWEGFREPPVDASTSEVLIGSRLLGCLVKDVTFI